MLLKNKKTIRIVTLFFVIGLMGLLTGCAKKETAAEEVVAKENEYILYFVSIDSTQLVPEVYEMDKKADVHAQITEMLDKLTKVPDSLECKNVMPEEVDLQHFTLLESGSVCLDVSAGYYNAVKSTQVLMRAALVKSLTQIDGVDMVEFTVDSQPMMEGENAIGALTSDVFVDHEDGTDSNEVQDVTVYFANAAGDRLEPIQLPVNVGNNVSAEQLVIEQLLAGTEEKGYYDTMPSGTKLLSVSTKDGVCYVDFSKEFLEVGKDVKDQVVIYSVVNSLCELSTVSKVAFTIEGEQQKLYNGNISFDQLFERNLDIVDTE